MAVNELIDRLQEYADNENGDAEVRLMTQCNWPFEYDIAGLTSRREVTEAESEGERECQPDNDCLFIVEGRQLCYGSKAAWDVAG